MITLGLILFNANKVNGTSISFDNTVGICLVLGSLLFDGLTSSQTDKEHKSSGRDYAYAIMFSNNFVQLGGNIIFFGVNQIYTHDNSLGRLFEPANSTLLRDVIFIGLAGALGQIFIYFAISLFNCYILTVITTSRKLISVVLSNFLFNHKFTTQ